MVSYVQWTLSGKRYEKAKVIGTLGAVFSKLKDVVKQYCVHMYVKRKQALAFQQAKQSVNDSTAVIQVDFAENYSFAEQDKIQSAHWIHQQCTIFTSYTWYSGDEKGSVIVSDTLLHTKNTVFVFMNYILENVLEHSSGITSVQIFSDGAASQFKQKYLFCSLTH